MPSPTQYNLLKITGGEETAQKWKEFQKARNECLSVYRKEQLSYYEQEIDKKEDVAHMKKVIIVTRRKINVEQFDEHVIENEKEVVNKLNQYFISSIEEIMEAFPAKEMLKCNQ